MWNMVKVALLSTAMVLVTIFILNRFPFTQGLVKSALNP